MNNVLLLKLHRWTSLVFALPLLAIIVTGLILSVEPMLQGRGLPAGTLDAARLTGLIERYDPQGQARGLAINATGQQMRLLGVNAPPIDLATGEAAAASDATGDLLLWARRTHERLLGYEWLVIASTIAMTVLMTIGVLMGLPRLRNSLAGWHKGAAWFTLPLLLLSPLTALCMAFGLTFSSGPPPSRVTIKLPDAVQQIAQSHDVSHLAMIANRGGRMMARIYQDGELRAYTFTPDGVTALPRNWPRLLHEGNWSTWLSGTLNVITSVVLIVLLITGVWLWTRRKLRRRPPSARSAGPVLAAPLS
ncbi:PepSY-associated TM helix domain protein [Rhodopseudomonas palustris TIE-1]|uniref:PepSY-associated TM helix domain-containing protein n=1 Tax=Rhodopseudomonas palustris TaxID=1076 RepID=UPI000164A2C2|nr:PepSY-associated TM helix domain-containing protein [Rhodopseudomonas palustris]ACE98660.1 PepSY-associated TM helix domain protein [Rhodopseudomonas palustris TIE-1]